MDRRTALRAVALGATGVPGCLGSDSGTEATTGGTTSGDGSTATTAAPTTPASRTATDAPEATATTTTDRCGDSVLSDDRRRVHSDYGLRIVEGTDDPAVAVGGEDWRSTLDAAAMSDADRRFAAETDFERFVLLVVQYRESGSANRPRVTDATVDGDTVRADICVVTRPGPNDAPTANLFVRVPYSESPPSRARVRIRRPTGTVTVAGE